MVLPDVVLTCFHVIKGLIAACGPDAREHMDRLSAVEVHASLGDGRVVRRLALGPRLLDNLSPLPEGFAPWLVRPGDPALSEGAAVPGPEFPGCRGDAMDFAFLRLEPLKDDVEVPFAPLRLLSPLGRELSGAAVSLCHFPKAHKAHPDVNEDLLLTQIIDCRDVKVDEGQKPPTALRLRYRVNGQTNYGSSGAAVVAAASAEGPAHVIGLHTASVSDDTGLAVPIRDILDRVSDCKSSFAMQLAEIDPLRASLRGMARRLARDVTETALLCLDRDRETQAICAAWARTAVIPVDVVVENPGDSAKYLVDRLIKQAFPGADPLAQLQTALRGEAGVARLPRGVPTWRPEPLGSFPPRGYGGDKGVIDQVAFDCVGTLVECLPNVSHPALWQARSRVLGTVGLTLGVASPQESAEFLAALLAALDNERNSLERHRGMFHLLVLVERPGDFPGEHRRVFEKALQALSRERHVLRPVDLQMAAPALERFEAAMGPPDGVLNAAEALFAEVGGLRMEAARQALHPMLMDWATERILADRASWGTDVKGDAR